MANIFVISSKIKPSDSRNEIISYNRNKESKIKLTNIENIFLLNNQSLNKNFIDYLNSKRINIFSIDKMGHIKNIYLWKKRTKPFNFKNPFETSKLIIEREMGSINSFRKRNGKRSNLYSSHHLNSIYNSFSYAKKLKDLRFSNQINLNEFSSAIQYVFPVFVRMYNSTKPENITINFFHSLVFCYLHGWFNNEGINPFKSHSLFCEKNDELYPAFLKAIFSQFRVSTTLYGLYTYQDLLSYSFFNSNTGELNRDGKLIISKIFTEKFVHNKNIKNKLENFWAEILEKDQG